MALSEESIQDTEFAKDEVMNSDLDQKCKKQLYHLLDISLEATNGISVDEKIQKITESIHGLVLLQLMFLKSVDRKIDQTAVSKCHECKAMAYVVNQENQQAHTEMMQKWAKENGLNPEMIEDSAIEHKLAASDEISWQAVLKRVIMSPGIWVLGTIMLVSPYSVDIVKAILSFFAH